jgi:hypothetical protein
MSADPRVFRLARLLLRSRRILVLTSMLASMPSCVLPVAPDFQDPLSSPNYAPFIIDSDPVLGKIVTATSPTDMTTFTVTVTDPNPGDDLHVRALLDYPDVSANTRTLIADQTINHSLDGTLLNRDVAVPVNCDIGPPAPSVMQHPVTIIIADRPFGPLRPVPTALTAADGLFVTANWVLNLSCP